MTCKTAINQRTIQQNKAIHKWCKQVSDAMIEQGVDIDIIIEAMRKKGVNTKPTKHIVKDWFRSVGEVKFGKESTAELTTSEVDEVFDPLARLIHAKTGIYIDFPSVESMKQG